MGVSTTVDSNARSAKEAPLYAYKKKGQSVRGNKISTEQTTVTATAVAEKAEKILPDIPDLQSRLDKVSSEFTAKKIKCEELTRENEKLSAMNKRLIEQSAGIAPDNIEIEGVRKPTVPQMKCLLMSLESLTKSMDALETAINTLRNRAQTKQENYTKLSEADLKNALGNEGSGFICDFNRLKSEYQQLEPRINMQVGQLAEAIAGATRSQIPEQHMETFSSHHQIPLNLVKEKADEYNDFLNQCKNAKGNIEATFSKMQRRFDNAAGHINYVKWAIEYQAGNCSRLTSYSVVSWPPQPKVEEKPATVENVSNQ